MPQTFSIALVGGFGLPLVGRYYWTRQFPNPEPINSHGPFLFKCQARADARRALGQDAREVLGANFRFDPLHDPHVEKEISESDDYIQKGLKDPH